jgi:hypothetical protein
MAGLSSAQRRCYFTAIELRAKIYLLPNYQSLVVAILAVAADVEVGHKFALNEPIFRIRHVPLPVERKLRPS